MHTVILEEPGRFLLAETDPPPRIDAEEALVRVRRVGICGTDLHAYRGRQPFFSYPRILGHELGVEIVEIGANDRGLKAGDRCAVEPYLNCGHCVACRRGKTNCCAHLKVLGVHTDGGMREYISVPIRKLHPSESLTLEQLALVETLGIGAHAVSRAQPEPGEWALVIGTGPIGRSVLEFAMLENVRLIVMDMSERRLEDCRRRGIEHTINAGEKSLNQIEAITDVEMPTLVFDATGNPASMNGAFQYVASGGKLVFVGLFQGDVTFHDPDFHRKELTLLSTRNSTSTDFRRIIRLMEERKIDTAPWLAEPVEWDRLPEEFPGWTEPGRETLKSMMTFG